jgi:ABC-type polysaccharide/polyol phosphate export permease
MIAVYRAALTGGPFQPEMLLQTGVWALVVGIIGVGLFVRYEGKIVRHL